MKRSRVLVVDPQAGLRAAYRETLESLGVVNVAFVDSTDEAQRRLDSETFDLVISALGRHLDGLALLTEAQRIDAQLPVILIAEEPNLAGATAALRQGAGDYLAKPLDRHQLAASARRLLERRRQDAEQELRRRQVERPDSFDDIIGASPAMRKVFDTIQQVASTNVDVLIRGETGAGKELVARAIHNRSRRAAGPFVPVDCGAIPDNLLESELFGHERGAFTGADSRRIGLVEYSDGGSFFLDELGELPLVLQAKLLRTLQERKIRRLGGHEETSVDVRVVAATSRDLDAMIRQGQFRQDLFYRIAVVQIDLPPLRDRGDDIGLLAEYFSNRHSREMGKPVAGITPEAYQVLAHYHWPGNVRELQNVVRRGIALTQGKMIGLDDLPDEVVSVAGQRRAAGAKGSSPGDGSALGEGAGYFEQRDHYVARFERQYLSELLARHRGDVRTAAIEAKLPRGTLYRLMKNHGLDGADYRSG